MVKLQKSLLSSDQEKQKSFWHTGFHLTVNQVVSHEQSPFHILQTIKHSSGCLLVNDKKNDMQILQYVGKHWSEVSLYLKAVIVNLIV